MTLIIKAIITLLLCAVFFSLGSALYYLIRDRDNSDRIVKALTWRIGLSLLVFVILFIAFAFGWITPHSV